MITGLFRTVIVQRSLYGARDEFHGMVEHFYGILGHKGGHYSIVVEQWGMKVKQWGTVIEGPLRYDSVSLRGESESLR